MGALGCGSTRGTQFIETKLFLLVYLVCWFGHFFCGFLEDNGEVFVGDV